MNYVLEALSREFRNGLQWEMLYTDDLLTTAESLEDIEERYLTQKSNMESKSKSEAKIMKSSSNERPVFAPGNYTSGMRRKGVGLNSVYCRFCSHWVHKRCSILKGRLSDIPNLSETCASRCLREKIYLISIYAMSNMKLWINSSILETGCVLGVWQMQAL